MKRAITLLRTRPGFRQLWLGNLISQMGDWIGWVAISVISLKAGGGLLELALVFAAHHLPTAALAPVAGPLSDRLDRRTLLVTTALVQAALTAIMVATALAGAITWLPGLLLLRSTALAFFIPAERAALPRVVERDELLLAGALDSGTWSVVFSLGMAVGGLLSALGPVLALVIDTATFALAALAFHRLPAMPPEADGGDREPTDARLDGASHSQVPVERAGWSAAMVSDIRSMWQYLWPRPELARAVLAKTPMALAGGAAWLALNAVAAREITVEGTALMLGVMHALRGVGTGIGPILAATIIGRDRQRHARVWGGLYMIGLVGMALFVLSPNWWLGAASVVIWGVGTGGNWVLSSETMQRDVVDRYLGRASALDSCASVLAMSLSVVGAAAVIEMTGSIAWGGLPWIALAAAIWGWLNIRVSGIRPDVGGPAHEGEGEPGRPLSLALGS